MSLYLDKFMTQLAYPLGLSLSLCLLALVLLAWGRRRLAVSALGMGVLWLMLWSSPVVSDALRGSLERLFVQAPVEALPQADVVVVLGGAIRPKPTDGPYPDLGTAADRVWHGARIVHAGKAPVLIASGGNMPWSGAEATEAEAMQTFLLALGVPAAAIILEPRSRTTRENALFTAELLESHGFERVLLVTSALHMRRALATFQAVGVQATPAPTDFEVMSRPRHLLDWLPDAEALAGNTRALKEYLGYRVYRMRGWIN